ncbi:MAG: dTMP kinase [Thaumarchaeota archaeon]|nr:dTMP kinase [Nitrososphaerota archaeon]
MGGSTKGVLIAIEGIDAVGKRTQSSLLNSWLRSKSFTTSAMSFPDYGTAIGQEVKRFLLGTRNYSPEVRHMLFAANRWEKKAELEAMLLGVDVVIVNRYSESNLAYGTSNGLPLPWLVNLEEGLPKSDLVLVLDASPGVVYRRRGLNKDRYERNVGLQERTRNAYLMLAKEFGWKVVDASQGIEATSSALNSEVSAVLAANGRTV